MNAKPTRNVADLTDGGGSSEKDGDVIDAEVETNRGLKGREMMWKVCRQGDVTDAGVGERWAMGWNVCPATKECT